MASVAGNGLHLSGRAGHGERDRESGTQGPADGVWERVRARLRGELGAEVYSSWFARAELIEVSGGTAQLSVPTRFLKSWIQSHYGERLVALMQAERDDVHRVEISVRTAATARGQAAEAAAPAASREDMVQGAQAVAAAIVEIESDGELIGSPLDARYTFETYRVGRANTLAAAAARKVAENGGLTFNPLYVHSAVGLGKTHLLQAIAWEGQKAKRPRRIVYLTAERFVYRFVAALRANTGLAFKDQLRGIDVLLIDDMQFLQGKATQTEFCHLLNALIDAGKQVVVAADRPPSDLESLDERVRSRLAGGLVAEMAAPDEALRCEILAAKAVLARGRYAKLDIPEDVLRYVARHVAGNGRDLDGAFTRLLAHNQLTGAPVTVDLAERVIRDLVRQTEPRRVRIEDIQRVVSKHYNVSRTDLVSSRRTRTIVKPRQIAMYLAKIMTPRSLPEIGRRFGGRDHTTVLHAVRKIDGMVKADQHLAEEVEVLKRSIEQ